MKPFEVTFVSHACLKISGDFGTLLCDPWFLNEPIYNFTTWKFPAAVIPPAEVVRGVTHLFITHAHEDHFHIPSIDHLSRDITVLLPEYAHHPGLRAQTIERTLRALGFHRIRKLAHWERVALSADTSLSVIPPAVTKGHDWENTGFVIDHPECKLLNLNDCPTDDESCAEIARRFGRFDIAFVQYAGVSMFPGCYRMTEAEMREAVRRKRHTFSEQQRIVERLDVGKIAPFAGDFCWLKDDMVHCNWANRATPKLFADWLAGAFPARADDLVILYPSDRWSPRGGIERRHPPVDWDRYLELIAVLKAKFTEKIDAVERWIDASRLPDLENRSRAHTARVAKWIQQEYIDFAARLRINVEGAHAGFSFVMAADREGGFRIDWDDHAPVDQTLHVRETVWAAVLEGKLMWNILQWAAQNEQHVPYRLDIGRFWFWLEYYADLNNRSPQVLVEPLLHPDVEPVRPRLGVFPSPDEWDLSWLTAAGPTGIEALANDAHRLEQERSDLRP